MQDFEYDVALSFANEDREYVETVANELQLHNVKVFYDKFEEASLWGKNLYDYLSLIYSEKSNYCIIFISEHYSKKQWTNLERESAQERAFRENREYVLPVRFDDTELPGLKSAVAYIDARIRTPSYLASLVLKKLNKEAFILPENAVLRFKSNLKIDFDYLLKSLDKYKTWDIGNLTKLPISILFPFNVQQRIDTYRTILDHIEPSVQISQEALNQAKEIYSEKYIKKYIISEIQHSIRLLYGLYLDEILNLNEFDEIIEVYAAAKLVNYIRNILAYRIIGTEDEEWLVEFYNLSGVYGSNLMAGLPYVIKQRENKQFLFWIDFDLYDERTYVSPVDHIRHYLYLPDNLLLKLDRSNSSLREDYIKYIVPQLIQYSIDRQAGFDIANFLNHPNDYSITLRKEKFYRVDLYKDASNQKEKLKNDFIELTKNMNDENLSRELTKKIIYTNTFSR